MSTAHPDDFEVALAGGGRQAAWTPSGVEGGWTAAAGGKEAYVQRVGTGYEARVYRHPTGPHGPDPQLAHGPQVFPTAEDALDFCEANLGV